MTVSPVKGKRGRIKIKIRIVIKIEKAAGAKSLASEKVEGWVGQTK